MNSTIKFNTNVTTERSNSFLANSKPETMLSTLVKADNPLDRPLRHLSAHLKFGMEGRLDPKIYVASIPCGGGKTETLCESIREWKAKGFPGGSGILIALATKDEIDAVRSRCELNTTDYSVITADHTLNGYGLGRGNAGRAKVIFTTHQQYDLRVAESGGFKDTELFYYHGKPRCLTVWDEGKDFAKAASFNLSALYSLPHALKRLSRDLAEIIEAILPYRGSLTAGQSIDIPDALAALAKKALDHRGFGIDAEQKAALTGLHTLAGGKAIVFDGRAMGWQFIGAGKPMSADVGPMIVLDASARLVSRYDQAKAAGIAIEFLPEAVVTYPNAVFHWYNRGAGKSALSNPNSRGVLFETAAGIINKITDEQWLLIIAKSLLDGSELAVPEELAKLLHSTDNIEVITWGKHKASNAYRSIKNIVVIGALNYADADYAALTMAATGQREGLLSLADMEATEQGEFISNLYQAICRGNGRNQVDGIGGAFNAHLIMPNFVKREALVRTAFPECMIVPGNAVEAVPVGKAAIARAAILDALRVSKVGSVAVNEIVTAMGGKGSYYLTRVFSDPTFHTWLIANGIERHKNRFRLILPALSMAA